MNWSSKASPTILTTRKCSISKSAYKLDHDQVLFGLSHVFCLSFQRFAVKTSKTLQDLSIKAEQTKQEVAEQIKEASKNFDAFKRQ
ncbi:uncharacterized protein LOC110033576 isoform X1 [Phalaenopsis equestris]|uniref:uncharacterized protein LOC110033576 isoform X1 n=1 Tax=Phalaenopsis equestris TaxID=78828 RepID=UPI0009E2F58A|nr:uncharacterized protein LOC110033576 isoform X1 [Phalaenopsis equestris]